MTLKVGSFYWVIPDYDPMQDEWEYDVQPGRFAGWREDGTPLWHFLNTEGTGWPAYWVGQEITKPSTQDPGKRASNFVDAFRKHRHTMPLQYVTSFLLVAMDEGRTVSEYAQLAGVSNSTMSRHLLDIGDRSRDMEEGLGLVTFRPRPENLQEHEYTLTHKGRVLWQQIVRIMED